MLIESGEVFLEAFSTNLEVFLHCTYLTGAYHHSAVTEAILQQSDARAMAILSDCDLTKVVMRTSWKTVLMPSRLLTWYCLEALQSCGLLVDSSIT